MTWAYGAFRAISMCKRGSDILKMRGGRNKTMFAVFFRVQQLCAVKVKIDLLAFAALQCEM